VCVIAAYLVEGLTAPEIEKRFSLSEEEVRGKLREGGIRLAAGSTTEPVASAVRALGYKSFDAFVRSNGHRPFLDQALDLSVSRGALGRAYDAYRGYLSTTGGRLAGGGPD